MYSFDSIVFLTDYLEELFPKGVVLYPKDNLYKKYKQRILVETLGSAVSMLINARDQWCLKYKNKKTFHEFSRV